MSLTRMARGGLLTSWHLSKDWKEMREEDRPVSGWKEYPRRWEGPKAGTDLEVPSSNKEATEVNKGAEGLHELCSHRKDLHFYLQ